MHISEMQEKIHKKSFIFEIMAFDKLREIVHIATGILVMSFIFAVNVLTNLLWAVSVKISDQTNAGFFQLNISQLHGKIG